MSFDALINDSAVLRHERHVTKAVQHNGLFAVLRVALVAWWNRPRLPPGLSDRLRADMGLPPAPKSMFWPEPGDCWPFAAGMLKP